MTEEIKTCDNNQKLAVYCDTCICQSCKRLEQENEELKNIIKIHDSTKYDYYKLMKENKELKEEINKLGKKHEDYCNTMYWQMKEQMDKYRSALEEIRAKVNQSYQMADRHIVLNIINEVLK